VNKYPSKALLRPSAFISLEIQFVKDSELLNFKASSEFKDNVGTLKVYQIQKLPSAE